MKVKITIMADVDHTNWCNDDRNTPKKGDPLEIRVCESVANAVLDAIQRQEGEGFNHEMESELSILVDYAKAEIVR